MKVSRKYTAAAGLLLGALSFLALYGWEVLDVTNEIWLLASERDLRAHYIGWEFFRESDWHWPLGMMDGIIYPRLISIVYTDSIPWLALLFKMISGILPGTFQYFGLWGLLCFMMQGMLAGFIVGKYCRNLWMNLLLVEFFVLSPTMIYRLYFHSELAAHFLLLMAFIPWIDRDKINTGYKKCIYWSLLFILTAGIHLYFIPMLVIVMSASVLYDFLKGHKIMPCIIVWLVPVLSGLFSLYLLGALSSSRDLGSEGGLGIYGINLNTLINPQDWAGLLPALEVATIGQYEGYAYLGAGVLLLSGVCAAEYLVSRKIDGRSRKNKELIFSSLFCIIATLLCAIGPVVTLGDKILFEIPYPSFVISILEMFRATGRFVWVIIYIILTAISIRIARMNKKYNCYVIMAGLVCCLALQVIDLYPMLFLRKGVGKESNYKAEEYNALRSPVWERIGEDYKHIEMMEAELMVHSNYFDSFSLAEFAVENGMTISNFAAARPTVELREEILKKQYEKLEGGKARDDTLYVFGNAFDLMGRKPVLYLYDLDGIIIGSKNRIEELDKQGLSYETDSISMDFKRNLFYAAEDAEKVEGRIVNSGEKPGIILYGPYTDMNTGIYNFQFEIDVLAGEGMAGYADVVSDLAAKEHAKVYFSAEDSRIVMEDVFLNGAEGVEIRIYAEEGSVISVNRLNCEYDGDLSNVSFKDGKLKLSVFDEEYYYREDMAKENESIRNTGTEAGCVVFGPYIYVPQGIYRTSWEYEIEQAEEEVAGWVDVCCDRGKTILAQEDIKKGSAKIQWDHFRLDKEIEDLELRIHIHEGTVIKVKKIDMEIENSF